MISKSNERTRGRVLEHGVGWHGNLIELLDIVSQLLFVFGMALADHSQCGDECFEGVSHRCAFEPGKGRNEVMIDDQADLGSMLINKANDDLKRTVGDLPS